MKTTNDENGNPVKNSSEIYGEGYVAGYNQHRVECGEITQTKADEILKKL